MKPKRSKLFDVPDAMLRAELASRGGGFLMDDFAMAACVLWGSGLFSTYDIATVLGVREDAVDRTLRMARDDRRAADRRAAE